MANNNRKPLTFNVSQETFNRFATLFPSAKQEGKAECTEQNFVSVLDAFENPAPTSTERSTDSTELEQRLVDLQAENERLSTENTGYLARIAELESTERSTDGTELEQQLVDLQAENERLSTENTGYLARIAELESTDRNTEQAPTILQGQIDGFTADLLNLVTERLREHTGVQSLTPLQVLLDGFLKYNIQQYNLWFYDFVVKKSEILALAHQYNAEIDTYKKLQKALGIYD